MTRRPARPRIRPVSPAARVRGKASGARGEPVDAPTVNDCGDYDWTSTCVVCDGCCDADVEDSESCASEPDEPAAP